jgi:hypothetical protein
MTGSPSVSCRPEGQWVLPGRAPKELCTAGRCQLAVLAQWRSAHFHLRRSTCGSRWSTASRSLPNDALPTYTLPNYAGQHAAPGGARHHGICDWPGRGGVAAAAADPWFGAAGLGVAQDRHLRPLHRSPHQCREPVQGLHALLGCEPGQMDGWSMLTEWTHGQTENGTDGQTGRQTDMRVENGRTNTQSWIPKQKKCLFPDGKANDSHLAEANYGLCQQFWGRALAGSFVLDIKVHMAVEARKPPARDACGRRCYLQMSVCLSAPRARSVADAGPSARGVIP